MRQPTAPGSLAAPSLEFGLSWSALGPQLTPGALVVESVGVHANRLALLSEDFGALNGPSDTTGDSESTAEEASEGEGVAALLRESGAEVARVVHLSTIGFSLSSGESEGDMSNVEFDCVSEGGAPSA